MGVPKLCRPEISRFLPFILQLLDNSRGWLFSCSRGNRSLHVGPPVKGRYLIVDLLKSFSLWTIDEREYRQNPGPIEKVA